jgi:hypothetical protein
MVDEFVYQFQDFCRFRSKDLKKRTPAELEGLAASPKVWDTMEARGEREEGRRDEGINENGERAELG